MSDKMTEAEELQGQLDTLQRLHRDAYAEVDDLEERMGIIRRKLKAMGVSDE